MPDIFLSYASPDLPRVQPLIRALEQRGWTVWWDRTIPPGSRFQRVIEENLEAARCVIVVWSQISVVSDWVDTEAAEGDSRGILVPVVIDDNIRIPLQFRRIQTARLVNWQDTDPHPEFERLVQAVTALLGPSPQQAVALPTVETPPHRRRTQGGSGVLPIAPGTLEPRYVNSVGMEFGLIPAGEFLMGASDGYDDERPVHKVRISQLFYLGKYAVTQDQWQKVLGNNPSRFTGDPNRPVENVSWEDVQEFIRQLNAKEGGTKYRLPTEAEWEYAARAGSTTTYGFGNEARQLGEYAWYEANSENTTHPVGQKKPNAWGLYDMHGNVWEWVQDWDGEYAAETVTDPQGPASGSYRVIRGGSWGGSAGDCRSASRSGASPGGRGGALGFRLLRTAP